MTSCGDDGFRATDLRLAYGPHVVAEGLDLHLGGGCTALVGPNGSGKSTLLAALARLVRPSGGAVRLDGRALREDSARAFARRVALLAQGQPAPDGVSVRTLVTYGRFPYHGALHGPGAEDLRVVERTMRRCGIAELADRPVAELSGGQAQRVRLACTLAQDTPWLLADEPTTYLDLGHQTEVLRVLRARCDEGHRRSVVMVLHDLNQAVRYADRIIVLDAGRVVADGAPGEVVDAGLMERVYGVRVTVLDHPEDGLPLVVPAV